MKIAWPLVIVLLFSFSGCARLYSLALPGESSPGAIVPKPIAKLDGRLLPEASALQDSGRFPGIFWTLNDSGNPPRLFAINKLGQIIQPAGVKNYEGIAVSGAKNTDWESLARDDQGHLYVGDIGNNSSKRRDLTIYQIEEPDPWHDLSVIPSRVIHFFYPEQKNFPDEKLRYDAEALFWLDGHLHLFTKHWQDRDNSLYRLDITAASDEATAVFLGNFHLGGMVTAADASTDGRQLAILTYSGIWLFERGDSGGFFRRSSQWLSGHWLPIAAKQAEGITFAGDDLMVVNEQGEMFRISAKPSENQGWRLRKIGEP